MTEDYSEVIKLLSEHAGTRCWKTEPSSLKALVQDMIYSEKFYEESFEEIGLNLSKTPEGGFWFSESLKKVKGAIKLNEELKKEFIDVDEYPPLTKWYKGEQHEWN